MCGSYAAFAFLVGLDCPFATAFVGGFLLSLAFSLAANSCLTLRPIRRLHLALYLGTSIGNFMPRESQRILRNLGSQLGSKDAILLGTDLVKDESTLVAAYHDNEGVTATFNLNILNRRAAGAVRGKGAGRGNVVLPPGAEPTYDAQYFGEPRGSPA
jgi:Histidine-specific methyltransferase, SAM-dependent